jgi:hypothetical protein
VPWLSAVTSTTQPKTARLVAATHHRVSRSRKTTAAHKPVTTGAVPSATTVPVATPVLATAEKNALWQIADYRGDDDQAEQRAA